MENKIAIPIIAPENLFKRAMDVWSAPRISIKAQTFILSTLTKREHGDKKHASHFLQSHCFQLKTIHQLSLHSVHEVNTTNCSLPEILGAFFLKKQVRYYGLNQKKNNSTSALGSMKYRIKEALHISFYIDFLFTMHT